MNNHSLYFLGNSVLKVVSCKQAIPWINMQCQEDTLASRREDASKEISKISRELVKATLAWDQRVQGLKHLPWIQPTLFLSMAHTSSLNHLHQSSFTWGLGHTGSTHWLLLALHSEINLGSAQWIIWDVGDWDARWALYLLYYFSSPTEGILKHRSRSNPSKCWE